MTIFLKQSTAQVIKFGPFLDNSDGYTPETAQVIPQSEMLLSKNGGDYTQKSAAGNATHDTNGWYATTFSTTDTDTVGSLQLEVQSLGALPVWHDFVVLPAASYDALFTNGLNNVAATDIVSAGAINTAAGAVSTVTTVTDGAKAAALTTVDTEIGNMQTNVTAILEDTGTTIPGTLSGLATAAALATVDANVDAILEDTGTTIPATLGTLATAAALATVDGIVDQILVDTAATLPNLIAAVQSTVDAILTDTGTTLPNTLSGLATAAALATLQSTCNDILTDTGTTIPGTLSGLATSAELPTNFSLLKISAAGIVDAFVRGYVSTLIAETTAGRISGNFDEFFDNGDNQTVKMVDDVGGTGSLTQQDIRDSMKLAPTAGAPAAGSIDQALDDIEVDTTIIETATTTNIPATLATLATTANLDAVGANVTLILEDTGTTLPATLASQASVDAMQLNVTAILDDTGTAIPSTLSSLATAAAVSAMQGDVTAILEDTGTTIPATLGTLATTANLNAVGANVTAILEDTGTTLPATLGTLATASALATVDTVVDGIAVNTNTDLPNQISGLNLITVGDIFSATVPESYAASGVNPTFAQAIMAILQRWTHFDTTGVNLEVKKIDGTTAYTLVLNDASNPTGVDY
jgi:hypothetical protein